MLNKVILMGRITRDPELRHTQSNVPVMSFTLAVDRGFKKDGQNTDFINIVAWRNTAEFVSKWFSKGQLMALSGRIQTRTYKDGDGNNRTVVEVVADEVFFAERKSIGTEREQGNEFLPPAADDFEELVGDNEPLPFPGEDFR